MFSKNQQKKIKAFYNLFDASSAKVNDAMFDRDGIATPEQKDFFEKAIYGEQNNMGEVRYDCTGWDINCFYSLVAELCDEANQKQWGNINHVRNAARDIAKKQVDCVHDLVTAWAGNPHNEIHIEEAVKWKIYSFNEKKGGMFSFLEMVRAGQWLRASEILRHLCDWLDDTPADGDEPESEAERISGYKGIVVKASDSFNRYENDEGEARAVYIPAKDPGWIKLLLEDCHSRDVEVHWRDEAEIESEGRMEHLHESQNEWRVTVIASLFAEMKKWSDRIWRTVEDGTMEKSEAYHKWIRSVTDYYDTDNLAKWFNDRYMVRRYWVNLWLWQLEQSGDRQKKDGDIFEILAMGQFCDIDNMAQKILGRLRELNQ